jgi:cytochrome c oxidase subunit 3
MTKHPFHIVDASPWPLTGSLGRLFLVAGLTAYMNQFDHRLMGLGLVLILATMLQWWRDVTREATFQGKHTRKVESGIRLGIVLFISSEVFFFLAFFWAFFHASLRPNIEVGSSWPPTGIAAINPFDVPLLNTTILLSSGATITWAHIALMEDRWLEAHMSLCVTVGLGIYFTALQAMEYIIARFRIRDGVYGRTFYVATGFHGLHVIIGTTFIAVILYRNMYLHFSRGHHFGFEARA